MKILLLSPYDTASHRYWCQGLMQQYNQFQWTYLPLPARHFNWRIRGNSLTYGFTYQQQLQGDYDLLIATSMTDLSALRGFAPNLAKLPSILYFHENQFAYPQTHRQHSAVDAQIISIYSVLCADAVVFNSQFNQQTFWQGASHLLKKMPDGVPANLLGKARERSLVIPVPLTVHRAPTSHKNSDVRLHVLWNHRWEYDKGPDRLLALVTSLPKDWSMTWHIVGQQFRKQPAQFQQLHNLLLARRWLGQWGFMQDELRYRLLLQNCDVVLSTAYHDFQGLSVQEAVLAGCIPLVPDDLAYPEWFADDYRYSLADEGDLQQKFAKLLQAKLEGNLPSPPSLVGLGWPQLYSRYLSLIEHTATSA